MKKLISLFVVVSLVGCAKKESTAGILGKCALTYGGVGFCTDYSYQSTSSKDYSSNAKTAAQASCSQGSGTWTDSQSCSTTTAIGYCSISATETADSDTYTLKYRQVYGVEFMGTKDNIKSLCESANSAALTSVWTDL